MENQYLSSKNFSPCNLTFGLFPYFTNPSRARATSSFVHLELARFNELSSCNRWSWKISFVPLSLLIFCLFVWIWKDDIWHQCCDRGSASCHSREKVKFPYQFRLPSRDHLSRLLFPSRSHSHLEPPTFVRHLINQTKVIAQRIFIAISRSIYRDLSTCLWAAFAYTWLNRRDSLDNSTIY